MGLSQPSSKNGPKRRLEPFWYMCWHKFGTSGIPSFDNEIGIEGQIVKSWLRSLPKKPGYRLVRFWFTCWHYFGTLSGIPSFDHGFNLECQMTGLMSRLRSLPRNPSHRLGPFWNTRAKCWHNLGSYPAPNPSTSNLVLKMTLKIRFKIIFVLITPNVIYVGSEKIWIHPWIRCYERAR